MDAAVRTRTDMVAESVGIAGWLRRALPTFSVLLILAAVAVWGHLTEWEFRWHPSSGVESAIAPLAELATMSLGAPLTGDLPPPLRRQISLVYPSAETVEKAGIEVAPVWTAPMTDAVMASGELSFDPNRTARLSSRAAGSIWKVFTAPGASVQAGEVLALVEASEVGKAKAELQQALVHVRLRQKTVNNLRNAGNAVPEPQLREADAALREAHVRLLACVQALVNLGLPVGVADFERLPLDEVVQRLRGLGVPENAGFDDKTGTANLLPIRASFAGVVLSTAGVAGEVVDPSRVLFIVVDPQRLWLTLHVPQAQSGRVALGQVVKFRPDGLTDEVVGKVSWIGTSADETTRTVPIRADVVNDQGVLRASTLGQGRIVVREEQNAIVVPREAVQEFRGAHVAFVRHPNFLKADGPKEFQVRVVRVGASDAAHTEIIGGLQPNEIVASQGANLLLGELNRLTLSVPSAP